MRNWIHFNIKTAVLHIVSQAKCRRKTDITDFCVQTKKKKKLNLMSIQEEKNGTIPKRQTQRSLLIYVNIFSIEVGKKPHGIEHFRRNEAETPLKSQ